MLFKIKNIQNIDLITRYFATSIPSYISLCINKVNDNKWSIGDKIYYLLLSDKFNLKCRDIRVTPKDEYGKIFRVTGALAGQGPNRIPILDMVKI